MKRIWKKICSRFETRRVARRCRESLPFFIGTMAHALVYSSVVAKVHGRYSAEVRGEWPEAPAILAALERVKANLDEVVRWDGHQREPEAEKNVIRSAHKMLQGDMAILRSFCDWAIGEFEKVEYKGVKMTDDEKIIIFGAGEAFPVGC